MKSLSTILIYCLFIPFAVGQTCQELIHKSIDFRESLYQLDSAKIYAYQALAAGTSSKDTLCMGNSHLQIGSVFMRKSLADSVLYHYLSALHLYTKIKDTERTATAYTNMSMAYQLRRQFHDGLFCAKEALKLWATDSLEYYQGVISAYNNIANCFESLQQLDSAIFYNKKALIFIDKLNNEQQKQVHRGDTEYGLSSRYIKKENYKEAQIHMDRASKLFIQQEDKIGEGMAYESLGIIAKKRKKDEVAEHLYLKAGEIYREIEDSTGVCNIYYNMGELYYNQKNYSKSKKSYEQALSFHQGSDKTFLQSIKNRIETVESQIKNKRLYLYLSILGLVVVIICTFSFWKLSSLRKKQILAEQERKAILVQQELLETKRLNLLQQERLTSKEKEVVESQKKLLKLDQIRHNIIKTNISAIENYIRTSANNPQIKAPNGSLNSALAIIKRLQHITEQPFYGQREKMSLGHLVEEMHIIAEEICSMNVQLYEEIDDAFNYPVKVSVQSHIEAIIYIAFNNIRQHADCQCSSLCFSVDENGLLLTIEDNGGGFNSEEIRKGAEGLHNIKLAVQRLNGSYNIHSIIGEGTKIEVCIPSFVDETQPVLHLKHI